MATKLAKREEFFGSGPVRYRLDGPPEAPIGASFTIDYTDAAVPEHYYVADYFELVNQDPQVLFVFGKLDYPNQDRLRNKLEIYFPALFFVKQLWKSTRDFHKTVRGFIDQHGYQPLRPGGVQATTEKVQTLHSNNVLMVLSGGECMMDFFYLSPRDFHFKARKRQNVELEPLVRVIASPTLLLGFLDACEPIAQSLLAKYPENEDPTDETMESS